MEIKCDINHNLNGKCSLQNFVRNISLDNEKKVLHVFELKNIRTIYDLIFSVSFFKFSNCMTDVYNNDSGEDISIHKLNINWKGHKNVLCANNKLKQDNELATIVYDKDICNIKNGTIQGKNSNINDILKSSINTSKNNNNINNNNINNNNINNNNINNNNNNNHLYNKDEFINNTLKNEEYNNILSNTELNKMNPSNNKEENNTTTLHPKHSNVMEINEMNNYYEKKKKECTYNNEYVYFDIYINSDIINIFHVNDKDKEKLIKYIYDIIETNDILIMCIYLNLQNVYEKLEKYNILNITLLKNIIEANKFEWMKNEIGISLSEFILIINFILKVKKNRIFCSNIFNQYNKNNNKTTKKKKNTKTLCDKIHQFIEFDNWTFKNIIDNPFFQRLRSLSQLGACQYVYPGATHSRFEHSLGVGFLSAKYFTHLCNRSNLSPNHGELKRMLRCVQIAGLCHDLGHGPFSHTFESFFMNYKKEDTDHKWNHASMSLNIAEHIIENLIDKDDVLDVSDIKIIKKLIKGTENNKPFCGIDPIDSLITASFDIICNNKNGLDADRFDYLQRDATIAPPNGTLPSLNCNRIIGQSAVINGHITYNVKEIHPVWTVYMNRFSLFKQVYTHRKVRAMELMLCDGFRLADDIFKWSESLNDLDSFLDLTDSSIIYDIKKKAKVCKYDEKLNHSLNLINSVIYDRNSEYTYKYISEINITEPKLIEYLKDITNEEKIARYAHGLSPDDIIIDWNYLNYGMGANDPLDSVYFYTSDNEDEAFIAHKEYRGTHPRYFEECNVRLYCKNKKVAHLAKQAHLNFISNEVFTASSPLHKKQKNC
ncbi:hypothetical protein PFAG_04059 [Plasmodium falciparum Santa Lucia]|uniref:HD/PDEase domain-containing protein n=3 Tax=Plasmodium falciparum TaxID=5833 RepID=W7EXZ1_PLAF8|nr:hypothetical protein PFNF135_04214 [Plasmodium falciparum NF135/5.C10]EUR68130.1 hypothetical protein PFBG_04095 [Plasmodium falciparum 7G8]EUT82684.1 hypothetical protein PFAG_04059 [Plasmodium falciparum Santa Lucia]